MLSEGVESGCADLFTEHAWVRLVDSVQLPSVVEGVGPGGNFMIVGVPRESFPGERRVALVPVVVPNLTTAGLEALVEPGAGVGAGHPAAAHVSKGAKIGGSRAEVFRAADIGVQVLCYGSNDKTGKADVPLYRRGQVLIGFLRPLGALETIEDIARAGVTSFA